MASAYGMLTGEQMANAVSAFLDAPVAAGASERVAIVTPEGPATYGELLALVNRAGNALRALGVEPEQRVALLLPDGLAWAVTFFGALRIGAVAVPFNTRLVPADWVAMIRDCRAKVLIIDESLLRNLREPLTAVPSLKMIVSTGRNGCDRLGDRLADASSKLEPEPVSDDDMAFWLYTSGTTGSPKAAVHLHRDLPACRHYGVEVLGASATDRVFATSKLFFAYALGNALLIPLGVGAQTYLHPAWSDPAIVIRVMGEFAPTLFFSIPTFFARLLRADLPPSTFRSLRCAVSAGERLPAEVYWAWRERFNVEILDGMGATETIFMVLSNRPGRSRAGSSGQVVPGTEAKILDGGGREVADNAEGVLHVRTPSASPFYWNRVGDSRHAFIGEWFRTGDVYARDSEGFFYHRGREDDLFKVAGMWVIPADVEAVFLADPRVADAAVIGAQAEGGLVKPFAYVVPKDPAVSPESLVKAMADLAEEKLAPHQRPRKIRVVRELPRTPTGKLQRFLLRERALD